MNDYSDIVKEIEINIGKQCEGDPTPLVYDMLKDTKHKKELLKWLGDKDADISNGENKVHRTIADRRISFQDWFRGF